MISNVIITPKTNLGNNRSLFIMNKETKEKVELYKKLVDLYNEENKTFFTIICFNDIDQSPDPDSKFILY